MCCRNVCVRPTRFGTVRCRSWGSPSCTRRSMPFSITSTSVTFRPFWYVGRRCKLLIVDPLFTDTCHHREQPLLATCRVVFRVSPRDEHFPLLFFVFLCASSAVFLSCSLVLSFFSLSFCRSRSHLGPFSLCLPLLLLFDATCATIHLDALT